jgi:hypothetical protein
MEVQLSFFVMVLCYSRLLYLEFTVSQTMEHFLTCHQHAFETFYGVPGKSMIDNLKSAVLKRLTGETPLFNPRYVKKNFLNGLDLPDFSAVNPTAQHWLEAIANVRPMARPTSRRWSALKKNRPSSNHCPPCPTTARRSPSCALPSNSG